MSVQGVSFRLIAVRIDVMVDCNAHTMIEVISNSSHVDLFTGESTHLSRRVLARSSWEGPRSVHASLIPYSINLYSNQDHSGSSEYSQVCRLLFTKSRFVKRFEEQPCFESLLVNNITITVTQSL
jgi:hypothetical protein